MYAIQRSIDVLSHKELFMQCARAHGKKCAKFCQYLQKIWHTYTHASVQRFPLPLPFPPLFFAMGVLYFKIPEQMPFVFSSLIVTSSNLFKSYLYIGSSAQFALLCTLQYVHCTYSTIFQRRVEIVPNLKFCGRQFM